VPPRWLRIAGKLLGKDAAVDRLLGSFIVDSTQIQKDLSWRPPWTMQAGLDETAKWYLQQQRAGRKLAQKRMFDIVLALFAAFVLLLPITVVALLVGLTSPGPVLYWSDRVGRNNQLFKMPKFRSMRVDTPAVATHLLTNPEVYLTPIGLFLRKSSLDELPQLWSILKGDMSFVGPRPALFNQDDLVALRTEHGVEKLIPGLTGWAQINGRDELPIPEKVLLDVEYLKRSSFLFDLKILWLTAKKVIRRDGVSH
jgi:O-antigen biosynthesis protein WbqP